MRNKIKNILSVLCAVTLFMGCFSFSANAAQADDGITVPAGTIAVDPLYDKPEESQLQSMDTYAVNRSAIMQSITIYPTFSVNGDTRYYPAISAKKTATNNSQILSKSLTKAQTDALIAKLNAKGYEISGWYIEYEIYADVYSALNFELRANGVDIGKIGAVNGYNKITRIWNLPEDMTKYYRYTLGGHLTFLYQSGKLGSSAITMNAYMNDPDPLP